MMDDYVRKMEASASFFVRKLKHLPDVVLFLGTGLGSIAQAMEVEWEADYRDCLHFPVSTAPSHAGRLSIGQIGRHCIAVFQGRFHYYEGYSAKELTFPLRVMAYLGACYYIGCSASGGLNPAFSPGDLMLIKDHINLIQDNPLRGHNLPDKLRFPDMSKAYTPELFNMAKQISLQEHIGIKEGVFVAVPGPSLETPAETKFLRLIGADAVAMSLVPEVIVAVHEGMKVLGISVIANVNNPDDFKPITIEDVIEGSKHAEERLSRLLVRILEEL